MVVAVVLVPFTPRELEGTKVVEMDRLAAASNDADEVKINVWKGFGDKDTSDNVSGENPPI